MEKLIEIYNDLADSGAYLFSGSYNLPEDCDAATIKLNGQFGVFLDIDKIRTLAEEKEAVSHEWAHIKTDATYHMDAPAIIKRRAEVRATRAQIRKVLPWDALCAAVRGGRGNTAYDLAEYFNVSESFVGSAVSYYTETCGYSF